MASGSLGSNALSLLDERDRQQAIIADAKNNIAKLNTLLGIEDEKLQKYIDDLNTLLAATDSDIQTLKARQVQSERGIAAKEKEITEVLGEIETIIGVDAMNAWLASLGEDEEQPKLPAPLGNGVAEDKVGESEIGSGYV